MKRSLSFLVVPHLAVALRTSSAFLSIHTQNSYHGRRTSFLHHPTRSSSTKFNKIGSNLYSSLILSDIEAQANVATETWSIETTPFMEPSIANRVEELFQFRGDVIAHRVVGGRRSPSQLTMDDDAASVMPPGEGRRSRFILLHPDLGLDIATAERDYCSVIRIQNVNLSSSNTFPNALASIGVPLDQVGDIVITNENAPSSSSTTSSVVYMVVDPMVAKRIVRLLSKELVGIGITLEVCEENEFMPCGNVQEMKLSKVLERRAERKRHEQGFVTFGG